MEPTRVRTPVGTNRSISSEISKPHNSASGSYSSKAQAKRPFPQPTSSTRLPPRAPKCPWIKLQVVNAKVDGGREMFFVTRGLVQGRPDAARNSGVSRGPSGRETSASRSRHYARVRKIGSPSL